MKIISKDKSLSTVKPPITNITNMLTFERRITETAVKVHSIDRPLYIIFLRFKCTIRFHSNFFHCTA